MSDLLSKIRELRRKATNGPWKADGIAIIPAMDVSDFDPPTFRNYHDPDMIVLLVNHLDEIEKALEESDGRNAT